MSSGDTQTPLKYAVDEKPPHLLAAGLGLQVVILIVAGIVLTPTIVLRAAGDPGGYVGWVVFAGLIVCGLTTMLHARPIGRFGAGYVLFMGTSGAFIAISIDALKVGGLPLLATLVVASSLIQFAFASRLGALRKIITPSVGGTVIMLIAVTVFPIAFDLLNRPLPGTPDGSPIGPFIGILTFVFILGVSLFASNAIRLWGPVAGVLVGSVVALTFGAFDLTAVKEASWVGLPTATWPGLDLSFSPQFWWLLLPFSIVTIVGAIETYGDGIAIQRLSRRTQDPIDFRTVQGAVNADGLGNLISGLSGTLPNTTYSTSLSVVDLTGVASRQVGLYGGFFLMLIAFCPKFAALLIAIPSPIVGAYVVILLVLLFMHGLKVVAEEGLTYENGMVVCISFWLGVGFQNKQIFPEYLPDWTRGLLDNGMTAGGIIAILLTFLVSLGKTKASRLQVPARTSSIPEIIELLRRVGTKAGWDHSAITRLELAGEEAMLVLIERPREKGTIEERVVRLSAQTNDRQIDLEFVCGGAGVNLENVARGVDTDAPPSEESAGLRILHGLSDRVRHEQFHGIDILSLSIESRPL
jgi:NCS2 family nucleobase:cation symporter-2/xanthine permease XanP